MLHVRRLPRASWFVALVPLVALVACSDDSTTTPTTASSATTIVSSSDTSAGTDATSTTVTSDTGAATTDTATGATGTSAATTPATGTSATGGTGGTSSVGSSDYSVAASLRQIPASALETGDGGSATTDGAAGGSTDDIVVVSGDLDAASELAGVARPKADDDVQEVVQWVSAITGQRAGADSPGVAIVPADAFNVSTIADFDKIDDELGWSMLDVSTYVELQAPPQYFTSMTGSFDQQLIDSAQGDRSRGIWSLGGDDFSVDVSKTSPARRLGQAVRSGINADGRLAQARSSQPIADWLVGSDALDRDDGLEAVAKALDGQGVYSAMLVRSSFAPDPRLNPAQAADLATLQPFDTLGIGSDHDAQGPILQLAYHSSDEQDATANVDLLRTLFTTGASSRTQQPWSDMLRLDDVQRDGKVVVVTLHLLDGRSPMLGVQAVSTHDTFATHV